MPRVEVEPDEQGFVSVRHGLGSQELDVRCLRADGSTVGYMGWTAVDGQQVEIATVPGCGVTHVEVSVSSDARGE